MPHELLDADDCNDDSLSDQLIFHLCLQIHTESISRI